MVLTRFDQLSRQKGAIHRLINYLNYGYISWLRDDKLNTQPRSQESGKYMYALRFVYREHMLQFP